MRTNIDIDDNLMRQAMRTSGARTKRAAVEEVRLRGLRYSQLVASSWPLKLRGTTVFYEPVVTPCARRSIV
jgi:hypothetical protein